MTSRCISLVAATLAVWSVTVAAASGQTTLRFKFKAGDKLTYTTEQQMKMTMNIQGKPIEMNMSQTADMVWSIKNVDSKDKASITVQFGHTKLTMDNPQGKTQVDSSDPQAPGDSLGKDLHQLVKAMAEMEISGTISPSGEFSNIMIPPKAVEKLKGIPDSQALSEFISADGFKRMLSQQGLVLPEEAIEKGKSWKNKLTMPLPNGKLMMEIDYTFAGTIEKDNRTLAKITITPKARLEPNPGSPFTMKLKSQEGGGTALFDIAAGRLLEVINRNSMVMETEVSGMTFTQAMTQSTSMRLAENKK